jgi:CBS-domain-containing membrane protein
MARNVRTCFTSDNLATAAQLMWDHDCGCVPVLNEQGLVVGMLTDRDICIAAFSQRVPISEIKVSAVMSRQLFVCTADDDRSAAERIMSEKKVRRLPVLSKDGRLIGLLSLSDIAGQANEERVRGAASRYVIDAEVVRPVADVFQTASRLRRGTISNRPARARH